MPAGDWHLPHSWHSPPEPDRLVGLDAITAFLELPFLRVRELVYMRAIPFDREGRTIIASRAALREHFAELEMASCGALHAAPAAELGLLRRNRDIAEHLRVSVGAVRHHRAANGLPVFKIGKTPYARRGSLDRWAATEGQVTAWDRRRAQPGGGSED